MPEQKVGNWHVLVLVKLRRTCTRERELYIFFLHEIIMPIVDDTVLVFNKKLIKSLMFVFLREQLVPLTKSNRGFVDTDKLYFLLHLHEFPATLPSSSSV